ncbi:hypothetical protein A9Q99_18085 [Gammaproteobacteria bacterium 45_16_T64]|nr:hypothetical protein A9Q99_18085 [Gammaproteobacteria bacterium 45_16_T64]
MDISNKHQYKAPDAELDCVTVQAQSESPKWIALKASFLGSTIIALGGGVIALIVIYPDIKITGFMIFGIFYVMSCLVACFVTLTYGKLVEHVIDRFGVKSRRGLVIGGLLPSIITLLYGITNQEKSAFAFAIVMAIYAIPISLIGYRLREIR